MSTQEFSQWVVDGNLERSKIHDTLTYMPGQSGYVGFEDIELSITQRETQVEITPHVESRSEIFPENKRFIEPETPVPASRNVRSGSSSGFHESETPQLPINPFENPFGPVHEGDGGMMALSQVFKATQAPSSPNLPRYLPSSQRPSPILLRKGVPDVVFGMVPQRSTGTEELMEMIEEPMLSSPYESNMRDHGANPRKRAYEEDDSSSILGNPRNVDGIDATRATKRKRISETRTSQQLNTPGKGDSKLSRNTRGNKVRQVKGSQSTSKAIVIEDEINTSEDETEHEDDLDDGQIAQHEDDSEGNKENRVVQQDLVPAPGSHIKRAPRGLQNQFIPLSSSPAPNKQTVLDTETTHLVHSNEEIAIADSQASQKVRSRLEQNEDRPQVESSNDSRKIIPQSQAVKPASSLRVVSEVRKTASQQTASPPNSTMGEDLHRVSDKSSENSESVNLVAQNKPVSPRSSPPILNRQHKPDAELSASLQRGQQDQTMPNKGLAEKTIIVPENEDRQSSQPEDHIHKVRITRSSSAIPETAYISRHGNAYATSFPGRLGNPFSVAEEMEFSFTGNSQVAEDTSLEDQRLAVSFGAHRTSTTLKSPLRRSPRRPITFSAIAGDSNTQEQDSLELDAIFTSEDQEIRDMLARMPGSGSSPLDPVRRKKLRKAPVLLNEAQIDSLDSPSTETTPVPAKATQINAPSSESMIPEVLQHQEAQNVVANKEILESSTMEKPALNEPIAFMEHSVPHEQYGRKSKRRQVNQAKASGVKTTQRPASTAPTLKSSEKSSASGLRSKHKTEGKNLAKTTPPVRASTVVDVSQLSGRAGKGRLPVGTQTPCSVLSNSFTTPTSTMAPNRVFAEFRGLPAGFFAATCLDCWKGEAELKYSVRFDDGTIDQLGQTLINRLELHVGDQVKVDRRQYKSNTFVVTGFGPRLDSSTLENEAFPMTDIYGHTTVHVKIEANGKRKSTETEELEVPITEVFFTRSMRAAFRDRNYSHSFVHSKPPATPTDSRLPSSTVSPHSRTRSTNKINLVEQTLSEKNKNATAADRPILHFDGLFKDVVFVFTNNSSIKQHTIDAIEREGGAILKGQKDIEDLFDTPKAHVLSDVQSSTVSPETAAGALDGDRQAGISIKPEYKETRLAVLVADAVCRTTKYYQALALGIPCVSSRWVVDCLQSRKLKSWRQYLLAAGESEILGTNVSQQLNFTHDEIDLCYIPLSRLIARREQWLRNASILLVGNRGDDSEKRLGAYTFFASILGATNIAIAEDSKEAERYLAKGKCQFDWICIDNEKDRSGSRGDRKGKRTNEMSLINLARTSMETIKVIDTRHVTESLILGSLVDIKDS